MSMGGHRKGRYSVSVGMWCGHRVSGERGGGRGGRSVADRGAIRVGGVSVLVRCRRDNTQLVLM